jgi:FtsP/CotA-like multicopper oxidase with cupredoxin domain
MRGTLVVEGKGGGVHPTPQSFDQPLLIPPVKTKSHITLNTKLAPVRVLPDGPKTYMWTYGGSYPGPTIKRPAGKDTKVTYDNNLPSAAGAISVHFHGDHHSAAADGQPTTHLIRHGKSHTYNYPLKEAGKPERAAFEYYHDHRMSRTAKNNWMGLQGMFITHDNRTPDLRLPTGKYDVPLLVADRSFNSGNQLTDDFPAPMPMTGMTGPQAPPNDATVGTHILVDGRYAPYLKVAAHRYRLRLLNGSDYTSYDFQLSDGRPFVQIGSGNGLLPKPAIRQDIILGPAQRADVIVDFHGELNKKVVLDSIPSTDTSPSGIGTPSAQIMQFRVTHAASDSSRIPATLEPAPKLKAPKHVAKVWKFGLKGDETNGTYWSVNGKPFDPKRVDYTVPLGSTQTWVLKNVSPITHYIHIHEERWRTIAYNGHKPPPWLRGIEDTWRLDPGQSVKVAAKFTDYPGVFMIHCHMLNHEDDGMMAQFAVVKRHSHALPAGYYRSANRRQPATRRGGMAAMSTPMTPAAESVAAPTDWARVFGRTGTALLVETMLLALVVGFRRANRRLGVPG